MVFEVYFIVSHKHLELPKKEMCTNKMDGGSIFIFKNQFPIIPEFAQKKSTNSNYFKAHNLKFQQT